MSRKARGDGRPDGMTLIELLVVIAIIGVLAVIAVPTYVRHAQRAQRTEATTALLSLREKQERWYLQHHAYTDDLDALGFTGGCSANCVYTIDFPVAPDAEGFTARARPTTGGGRNDVDQTGDDDCQWFTLTARGERGAGPGTRCW